LSVGKDKFVIAQAKVELTKRAGSSSPGEARQAGNFVLNHRNEIEYMDVSPCNWFGSRQPDSVLENDDAKRALRERNAAPAVPAAGEARWWVPAWNV
jgi:DNA-directed RNA polymerase beta subunit